MKLSFLYTLAASLIGVCAASFEVGISQVDITPDEPIFLSGYAARTNVSEGIAQPIFTKAIAIRQSAGEPALMLTVDNCGLSKAIRDQVVTRIRAKHPLAPKQIVIFNSHTHAAPCLSNTLPHLFIKPIPEEQVPVINRYTQQLVEKMTLAADEAFSDLQPSQIYRARGTVGFAKNRRQQGGPVDHDLPILVFKSGDTVRGVLATYACHCTTAGTFNQVHGDWAGFAQQFIAEDLPGAAGFISIGCGADSNPHPRGSIDHARTYGRQLADEVTRLLAAPMEELTGEIEFRAEEFALPFDPLPTIEEWEKRALEPAIVGYHARINTERLRQGETLPEALPYQVQAWNFGGQFAMVFLPGEVVVDYAVRLKSEFDRERLWVSAYANWVPCYIPSERILREGGYEAETSLWYYDWPSRLAPGIEDLIIGSVHRLLPEEFRRSEEGLDN